MFRRTVLLIPAILLLAGCGRTGYFKSDGDWHYGFRAGSGYETRSLNADLETFRILGNSGYACDRNHVYKYGIVLNGMDGASYELLEGNNYARDRNYIYYRDSIVLNADRNSFRVLEFPYSRDDKNIYCGSLRMNVDNPDDFKVLESKDTGTSFFYSTHDLVERLGDEFADHLVLYDAEEKNMRFRVASSKSGTATDGVWLYAGPRRVHRVR